MDYSVLPDDLPAPVDDGACAHLVGMTMPHVALFSSEGGTIDLGAPSPGRTILYCYPMTGTPGRALPQGWDAVPGARGCTPQACGFRDHARDLESLGAQILGLSTQTVEQQAEAAHRLHLPYPLLSDAGLTLTRALRLPTFMADAISRIRRLTLVIDGAAIEHVFYPVFPPDRSAAEVVEWLHQHPPA